jgi:hypothetical protein
MKKRIKDTIFIVWKNDHTGLKERCLMNIDGNFIGIETGRLYLKEYYYASLLLKGQIIAVDSVNKTGMLHLHKEWADNEEENQVTWKNQFLGAIATFREGHYVGEHKIYYCVELNEYFSDDEVKILQK